MTASDDYGDACHTLRFTVRDCLAKTAHITGLRAGDKSEAVVEAIVGALHDRATLWMLDAIVAKVRAT